MLLSWGAEISQFRGMNSQYFECYSSFPMCVRIFRFSALGRPVPEFFGGTTMTNLASKVTGLGSDFNSSLGFHNAGFLL
jgi:hypothetical protein